MKEKSKDFEQWVNDNWAEDTKPKRKIKSTQNMEETLSIIEEEESHCEIKF